MKRFSLKIVISVFVLLLVAGAIYFAIYPLNTPNDLSAKKVIPTKILPSDTQPPTFTPTATPTLKPVYIPPTTIPASATTTSIPTTPLVTSQQTAQPNNGATALCNDGTYSYAAHDQGACFHHQGVQEFYK